MRASRSEKRASRAELGRLERVQEPLPELLERGQVDREQPVIRGAQDVGLGKARAVARFRRLAEREIRRKGLHGEMRHRLEHRDLDEASLARRRALEQRAENAEGGVDAGDRVCERGAEEARTLRVHDDAEESGERLRDRVVARALGIRPVCAESADRAVDEPRVEAAQPLDARAEALGRARPEILDVHVGARDQLVEELAVGRDA